MPARLSKGRESLLQAGLFLSLGKQKKSSSILFMRRREIYGVGRVPVRAISDTRWHARHGAPLPV